MGSFLSAPLPAQGTLEGPGMKTSVMLFLAFLHLLALASFSEGGCSETGCCYCNGQTGRIINMKYSQYRTRCNPGHFCTCGFNDYIQEFFGKCDDGSSFASGPRMFVPRAFAQQGRVVPA